MNFSWWTLALQAANFLILVWLLQRFLFKPVKAMVIRRKEEVSHALAEAAAEKLAAERLRQDLEAAKTEVRAVQQKMIDQVNATVSSERRKMIDEARSEVEQIHNAAIKRLEDERAAFRDELYARTVELATSLAERMLIETAESSVEQRFLRRIVDYLDRMPPEERSKLLPRNGYRNLLVTTAHRLDASEQSNWREQLARRLGAAPSISFNTDPALLAGAVLTFPHAILNFNWRDTLALALRELHGNGHAH
jgi:F-type H+-transporting ATPase subunit b